MIVSELIDRLSKMPLDAEVQMDIDWTEVSIGDVILVSDGTVLLAMIGHY